MKDTNVILYDAGAYGNFINWCCAYFSKLVDDINTPYTDTGSVHNRFNGNSGIMYSSQINKYIKSNKTIPFMQTHPVFITDQSKINYNSDQWFNYLQQDFKYLSENFKKNVYIYPTKTSISWIINNCYYKIKTFQDFNRLGVSTSIKEYCQLSNSSYQQAQELTVTGIERLRLLLNNELSLDKWNFWNHKSISEFDLWELRELSSRYFYDRCHAKLYSTEQINSLKFDNMILIALDELRDNFVTTLKRILDYFNIPAESDELKYIYSQWKNKQDHIYKDQYISKIVFSLVNEIDLDWEEYNLTFFDEIFIQRSLLDQGIEIACYGVNKFPTNTKDFSSILINTNQ
jgi:hypothetical protein